MLKRIFILILILASFYNNGESKVLLIKTHGNTYHKKGIDYGEKLSTELRENLSIIKSFYTSNRGIKYNDLVKKSNELYILMPTKLQRFIVGEAQGASISLEDAKILNAMETFVALKGDSGTMCAFAYTGYNSSKSKKSFIGRNYDYAQPFDKISKNLVITTIKETNKNPVAIIGLAGQVYCPTCINKSGIFIELNNGFPSGGTMPPQTDKTMGTLNSQLTAFSATILFSKILNRAQPSKDFSRPVI